MRLGARLRLQRFPLAALRLVHLVQRQVEPRPRLHGMPPGGIEPIAACRQQVRRLQRREPRSVRAGRLLLRLGPVALGGRQLRLGFRGHPLQRGPEPSGVRG